MSGSEKRKYLARKCSMIEKDDEQENWQSSDTWHYHQKSFFSFVLKILFCWNWNFFVKQIGLKISIMRKRRFFTIITNWLRLKMLYSEVFGVLVNLYRAIFYENFMENIRSLLLKRTLLVYNFHKYYYYWLHQR